MAKKSKLAEISINQLVLDINNPRFSELYSGSSKEEDLIEYLLYTESGDDIARGIVQAKEFYPDRPLWVIKKGNKFLVKDGNRRCAAAKALQFPSKYGLNLPKFGLAKLPVLIYANKNDLEKRIIEEHTASLFKEWERIAKALKVHKMYTTGSSIDSMKEIDSSPSELIKLASFYYEAVQIGGDDLKKLLRRGRGKTGGKTIIFERMFKFREVSGYRFKSKPSYEINVFNREVFEKYVSVMIEYLKSNPDTTHKTVDDHANFLSELKIFGFNSRQIKKKDNKKKHKVGSTKKIQKNLMKNPVYDRDDIPTSLVKLIDECYDLNSELFANAKIALARVTFECTLKFVVENTKYNSKTKLSKSNYFNNAFIRKGKPLKYEDFTVLKNKFTELIMDTGIKKAFMSFDLENMHQIIHNYNVGAIPADAEAVCGNLKPLLEFMLQTKTDLLKVLKISEL